MTLLEQVEELWEQGAETRAAMWARKLRAAKTSILAAKEQFHDWYPLKAYICYTGGIQPVIPFSIRYLGQEVATLRVASGGVSITISPKTAAVNKARFDIDLDGHYDWREAKAQEFRRHFQSLNHRDYHLRVKSEEHHVESEFLRHMKDSTGNKFHGTLRGIQPVMLGGLPFQFPVPFAAHKGVPKLGNGNIDILARRGTGAGYNGLLPPITTHCCRTLSPYTEVDYVQPNLWPHTEVALLARFVITITAP